MKLRTLKQRLFRLCLPELHGDYVRMCDEHAGLKESLHRSRANGLQHRRRSRHLWAERADLTEMILSLVAKDEHGHWVTVFDENKVLPDTYQCQLNLLVSQA